VVNVFLNDREGRLRAFWRLLFQYGIYIFSAALLGVLVPGLLIAFGEADPGGDPTGTLVPSPASQALSYAASLAAALFSVWLAGRFLDHRPISDFGLRLNREWWLDLCFGLVLGALLMAGIFLVELAAGWIAVTGAFEATSKGAAFFPVILAPLVLFICVGISEELVSRGYQLRNLAEGLNFPGIGPRGAIVLAWVLSSSYFGYLHMANPNATLVSTANIALIGLVLGVGYILTGRLAIPIGLHIAWNFFQGNVFGFPVSGIEPVGATFLSVEQGGPSLFTGGPFGPEGGLLGIAAAIIGSLLTWLWVYVRSGKAVLQTSLAEPPTAATD
jgi:uncharacterized protein